MLHNGKDQIEGWPGPTPMEAMKNFGGRNENIQTNKPAKNLGYFIDPVSCIVHNNAKD